MRRLILLLCVFLILPSMAAARTWYIRPDGTGDAPTIQAGVDSAIAGDTVLLADGTYTGDGNRDIDYHGKAITVRSESGDPELCVIDCQGTAEESHRGFAFGSGEGCGSVLEGVTITNGYWTAGGGGGGAICCYGSSPCLSNMVLRENHSLKVGGGMECGWGSSPTLTNVRIVDNVVDAGNGGGLCCRYYCHPTLDNVVIYRNASPTYAAGGIFCSKACPVIQNCTVVDNLAERSGGGMECWDACPTMTNVTFFGNSAPLGGGICTRMEARPALENTIIAFSRDGGAIYCRAAEAPILNCCNLYGNADGDWTPRIADQYGVMGNICACPSFCKWDVEPYDLRLCDESPCAPGNHPDSIDCGLIGALGEGCSCGPTHTVPTTWGAIKSMYR